MPFLLDEEFAVDLSYRHTFDNIEFDFEPYLDPEAIDDPPDRSGLNSISTVH